MNRKLLIISDTKIQKKSDRLFGFNSVVLELDVFTKLFDKITWIAFDYSDLEEDLSLLEIKSEKVDVVLVPRSGGKNVLSKLKIAFLLPYYLLIIIKYVRFNSFIHVRGPSGPMYLSLLVSILFRKKAWIVKYANNWSDGNAPIFWKKQKSMMIKQKWILGTVNGQWPDMPNHLFAFENPCINPSIYDPQYGMKFNSERMNLLFVGRIEFEKGIRTFLDSVGKMDKFKIGKIYIVGTGKDIGYLNDFLNANSGESDIIYMGAQSKDSVIKLMEESHFLILPTTASEGFPKVVAEAWSVGCLPICSDISSIGQYVKHLESGFIWNYKDNVLFEDVVNEALNLESKHLRDMVYNGYKVSQKFTYLNYEQKLTQILEF